MNTIKASTNSFSPLRWSLIFLFLGITLVAAFSKAEVVLKYTPVVMVLAFFTVVILHGRVRYGLKNILVFFIITWLISNSFEALSIQTGFPFGHYYYDQLMGPRLFEVPLIIMLAYFGTGYSSWILAQVLLGQQNNRLTGKYLILVPLIASFIMVSWDLCIDPLCSTIASLWVWRDGGAYFGVPLQNFFGWFLVVYIIYQLFAFYCLRFDVINPQKTTVFSSKVFWLEIVAVYGIQGLSQIVGFAGARDHLEIYGSMALVTIFTMLFITLLSYLKISTLK